MLINFTLVPIENIHPWGNQGDHYLHWFGLTDGEYWIQAGNASLFEYSAHAQTGDGGRYCAYQVVRLYEDLIEMLPYILEPIPDLFEKYIWGDTGNTWQEVCSTWFDKNCDFMEQSLFYKIYDSATAWIGKRTLDSTHLSPSAKIAIWSDQEYVYIGWDNREKTIDEAPAWTATLGKHKLPRDKFLEEVKSFHHRLMAQMATRITQIQAGALAPDIKVDLPGLIKEQEQRLLTLDTSLSHLPHTDWEQVKGAIRIIQQG